MADLKEMEAQQVLAVPTEPAHEGPTHYVVVTLYDITSQKQVGRTGTCGCSLDRKTIKAAAAMACNMITLPKREESQG